MNPEGEKILDILGDSLEMAPYGEKPIVKAFSSKKYKNLRHAKRQLESVKCPGRVKLLELVEEPNVDIHDKSK